MKYNFKKSARSPSVWYYEFLAKYNAPHFEAKSKPPWPSMNALESWRPTLYLPISSACCTQILPHIFPFFTFFLHILYMFLFSHFHTFLKFLFVCRQMFPQMKFRLTGLDPKVSQSIASGIFSPLVAGQVFCPAFICRTCFLPHFLIAGQVHSPTRHCCLWRLSLQVPQQVSLICRVSQKKVDNGFLRTILGCQNFGPLWTI